MEPKADRTRRYIIEKAAHLFNRKGYHGTSMSDILEATGLAKGGVYGHFKSKDEIVSEAFSFAFYKVMDDLAIRIRSKHTALEKLETTIDYYKDYLTDSPIEGGCPLLNYTSHSADAPELEKQLRKATQLMLDSLERILEKGKKYGQVDPAIDVAHLAEVIHSRIEGAIMLGKSMQDNARLNRLLDALKRDLRQQLAYSPPQ